MNIDKPALDFLKWVKWENRGNIANMGFPGIYAIAITDKNLDNADFNWHDVVYIGMSTSRKGLKDRLYFLDKAINGKSKDHSGGKRMYEKLGNYETWSRKMFVVTQIIPCNVNKDRGRTPEDLIKMGWIAFLEYEALAKYKEITGNEPTFNKK